MSLKKYNPITPSQRHYVSIKDSFLWKGKPVKALTKGKTKSGGRNNYGRITARHIGGGHKQKYRIVDFKRDKFDVSATVERIEYDPNRSSYIALLKYDDGELRYIIAPNAIKSGDKIISSSDADIKNGNTLPLKNIPIGTRVHCIEGKPGAGAVFSRAAGGYADILGKDSGYVQIRFRSGEVRLVSENCLATIGVVSNHDNKNIKIGKAGRKRWLGKRPVVRGVAMNPVDHPHGGGEGKSAGGRHPVTPWGKSTKGKKTRSNKRTDKFIFRSRHKNK